MDRYKELMSRSHVLLLLSRAEVIPGLVREANLLGVPCMVPAIGALPEMIEDGVTGWLVS